MLFTTLIFSSALFGNNVDRGKIENLAIMHMHPSLVNILWLKGDLLHSDHLEFCPWTSGDNGYDCERVIKGIDVIARIYDCGINRNDSCYNVCWIRESLV
jgi:hypothetical protein